ADSVKFLTFECDEGGSETNGCPGGGTDLNNDGDAGDLVIRELNVRSLEVKIVGTVDPGGDPLRGDPVGTGDGSTDVFISHGRCIEDTKVTCSPLSLPTTCDNGGFCDVSSSQQLGYTCHRDQGVCSDDSQCPPGVACRPDSTVPASSDVDHD